MLLRRPVSMAMQKPAETPTEPACGSRNAPEQPPITTAAITNKSSNGICSAAHQSNGSPTTSKQAGARGRRDRPCDACRRRKSRCVMGEGAEKCLLCQFHSQECTFVQSPQPRKRKFPSEDLQEAGKKRTTTSSSSGIRDSMPVTDYSQLPSGAPLKKTLGLQGNRHAHLVGPTAEYERELIQLCPFDVNEEFKISDLASFRTVGSETFVNYPDEQTSNHAEIYEDLDKIERLVAPHGRKLVKLYFRIVHPSFPILHKKVFLEKYARTHREFAPPLLAAVYILALNWWNYDQELSSLKKPDVETLVRLAGKTMGDVVHRPKLSTVQAGLLLLQRNEDMKGAAWALTAQMVAVGQELGLHLDCTDWKIPDWEKGLRRRLAWALYMQDKWGALTHGRPSHITKPNWAVQPVSQGDFPLNEEDDEEEEGSQEVEKGRVLFTEMIKLCQLMAEVLETFFTIEAQAAVGGQGATQRVLERCKPIQLRLKEWFSTLPDSLRMETATKAMKLSSTGYLHLAYFATEITLHRQILRTLSPPSSVDPYLLQICRSAAKTRLISAMDFVNRLKPEHLQSFWYFASKTNFALIGTFGSLLWATSPSEQEAEFYKARLAEYRWTLRVSSKGADFMTFAVGVLDASAGYMQQEQFHKRGFASSPVAGYMPTGAGESFGLGMGVGLGIDINTPPPLAGWTQARENRSESQVREPISPMTAGPSGSEGGEDEYDDEMEEAYGEDDAMTLSDQDQNSATSSRRGTEGNLVEPRSPPVSKDGDIPRSAAASPSSPVSSAAGGADFFMIPNAAPTSVWHGSSENE